MWRVGARRISPDVGQAAVALWRSGNPDDETLAAAVRYSLQTLRDQAPGSSVEVRVPPYGAVQVIEGPHHTRGTPSAVVETDPQTWLALATGTLSFADALGSSLVQASGVRSDLSAWLPCLPLP